jgi:Flp pilus assembly protein TadG
MWNSNQRTEMRSKHAVRTLLFKRCSRRGICASEGGSLIEFALIVPMMMVLITGMFSVGIALNNYMVLTDVVGSGARALALARGQTIPTIAATDPCAYTVQTINSSASGMDTTKLTYSIVWTTTTSTGAASTSTYTNTCSGVSLSAGDTVQVKASYPFSLVIYGLAPGHLNIQSQTTQLVQ